MPRPHCHLFEVSLEVSEVSGDALDLQLPIWAPGAYKLVDNARNLRALVAQGQNGALPVERRDLHTWRVQHGGAPFTVSYQVYANKPQIHQAQLTATHAMINGAALFVYPANGQDWPCELRVDLPEGWEISVALTETAPLTYAADSYDALIDAPIQAGRFERASFEALGVPHEITWQAPYPMDRAKVVDGLKRLVETEAAFWAGPKGAGPGGTERLPYERYLFQYQHGPENFLNGLEHRDSMMIVGPMDLAGDARGFFALTAHEVFHAWNVKRLRPLGLGPFDYQKPAHTTALWVVEGLTEYFTELMVLRSGLQSRSEYLRGVAANLQMLEQSPGRLITSLSDSSFITWNFGDDRWNGAINYYLKGSLVGLALDLTIRHLSENRRALDDVMRELWERFGETDVPYHPLDVEKIAAEVAEADLSEFFDHHLRRAGETDLAPYLAHAGLRLEVASRTANLQARFASRDGGLLVEDVRAGGAAQEAGLIAGDLVVAVGGNRASEALLTQIATQWQPDELVPLHFFRGDQLCETILRLGADQRYAIQTVESPTALQQAIRDSWLGSGRPAPALGTVIPA
jgi:predicted metalloprotease with PDZ domain